MDSIIRADLHRYYGLKGTRGFLRGWFVPGFRYTYFFRKAGSARRYSITGLFYKVMLRRYMFRFGFQIPIGTQIGSGFYIGHFGNVIINRDAVIGMNCNVSPGVTIGRVNRGKLEGCPVIGDYVWIGTNAVVVGKILIGSHVLIAPNSFVNFDVPDRSIVIGNPARIIPRENPTEGYITDVL